MWKLPDRLSKSKSGSKTASYTRFHFRRKILLYLPISRRLVVRTHLHSFLDGSISAHSTKAATRRAAASETHGYPHVSRYARRPQLFWNLSDSLARRSPRPTVSFRTNAALPVSATLVHRAAHPSRDGSCGSSQPENIRITCLRAKSFLDRRHFRSPGRIPRYQVWGGYVHDADHGWNDLHPVSSMQAIQ